MVVQWDEASGRGALGAAAGAGRGGAGRGGAGVVKAFGGKIVPAAAEREALLAFTAAHIPSDRLCFASPDVWVAAAVGVGAAGLRAWWAEFGQLAFPGSYGDSGYELASGLAYRLLNGLEPRAELPPDDPCFGAFAAQAEAWRRLRQG